MLRGDLASLPLAPILGLIELERLTGVLMVQQGRSLGRVFVREGRLLRARVEGPARLRGREALFTLLSWDHGHFDMWQKSIAGVDDIDAGTCFLLMEHARREDEHRATQAP